MTSSVPPIYLFNDFNDAFFPSSNNLNSSYLSSNCNYLLHKNTPDTATALISFNNGNLSFNTNSIEPITISGGTMTIFTTTQTKPINIFSNTTSGNISFYTDGNIYLGNPSATTGVNNLRVRTYSSYPLTVISSNVPTAVHIGYITTRSSTRTSSTASALAGTFPLYSSNTLCAYGQYLVSITCSLSLPTFTAGSITTLEIGYTFGTNSNATLNTKIPQYTAINPFNTQNSGEYIMNYCLIVSQTSSTGQYIAGYATYTQTALTGGTSQISIHNFSIMRIG